VFGPPVAFVIGLVAILLDRRAPRARAGFVTSLVVFGLWLAAVVCDGFS
jgi:uncharacterized membrane protein YpjA